MRQTSVNNSDVNRDPSSDRISIGCPKLNTQWSTKSLATLPAVPPFIGVGFTNLVSRSLVTKIYLWPLGVRISSPCMSIVPASSGAVAGNSLIEPTLQRNLVKFLAHSAQFRSVA